MIRPIQRVEYFKHKKLKNFLKRCRALNIKLRMCYLEDNSIGLPQYELIEDFYFKSLKMELWDMNATYHYIINESFSFEIPADAEFFTNDGVFGYEWRNGPTNHITFKEIEK